LKVFLAEFQQKHA